MKNNKIQLIRVTQVLSAVLLCLTLSNCATRPIVQTDFDAKYNFAGLKSFAIKETKQETASDIKVSPFTLKQIQAVLSEELSKRYTSVAPEASPDFFVSYHLVIEDKLDTRDADLFLSQSAMGGTYRHPSPFFGAQFGSGIKVFNQGSLIIDFVDAKTLQPIWRGVSEKRLGKDAPSKQRALLTAAVLEVLAQFPPKNY
jgi:Domain of unknown function (DUF4136)